MKVYKKRCLIVIILIIMSFGIQACNKSDKSVSQETGNMNTENTEEQSSESIVAEKTNVSTKTKKMGTDKMKSETSSQKKKKPLPNSKPAYDSSKSMKSNISILNGILKTKYGKRFSLSTMEVYEKAGQSDWSLISRKNKVAIDTATWKYGYKSNSDNGKYMDAILTTFIFFYGEEMGNALWLLTDDLLDGGADESLYGFTHKGGRVIHKSGHTATYESNKHDSFYLWLTPAVG